MATGIVETAKILAVIGEGRKTTRELGELFVVDTGKPGNALNGALSRLKKAGKIAKDSRTDPWRLTGPKPTKKSMEARIADEVEDLYDWLASSPEPRSNPEIAKHFDWDKGIVLKRLAVLRRTTRVELVGGGNHRKWRAVARAAAPKAVRGPAREIREAARLKPYRDPRSFGSDLDDHLKARLADLDRERDAILVLLETR